MAMLLGICTLSFAQVDPGDNPDIEVPLDGGVLVMAAAGAVYAVKKLRNSKELKQNESNL